MKVRRLRKRKPRGTVRHRVFWFNVITGLPATPTPLDIEIARRMYEMLQRTPCAPYTPDGWPMLRQAADEWLERNGPPPGYEVRRT